MRANRRGGRERRSRLLLLEPPSSPAFEAISQVAASKPVRCTVEPVRGPDDVLDRVLPDGTAVGVGPSIPEPVQVARRLRAAGVRAPLIFFAESARGLDALRAELLRDPFAVEQCELLRVDDPHSLENGLRRAMREVTRARRATTVPAPPRPAAAAPGVSDYFLTSILSQANDAIISTDPHGVLLTWNDAAETLFGYASQQAIGQPVGLVDCIDGEGAPDASRLPQASESLPASRVRHAPGPPPAAGLPHALDSTAVGIGGMAERVLRTGTPEQGDVTCRRADGSLLTVAVSIAPVRNPDGRLLGLSIIARDNSDQRRAAEALREANRQKDEFLAIMSHELRTPLTSILGYTDMLLRGLGGPLAAKSAGYLSNVRTAGDRLLELVNGLLDFTRLEAGREQVEVRPIRLQAEVRAAVERVKQNARTKGIRLETRLDRSADRVLADPEKLQHVLQSYLANAIKFTPADGKVCVEVRGDAERPDEVLVSVSDSGIGLREDQLGRVWEHFYQGDASLTRAYGGMGLGLSIARHLVQLHGGRVGVESPGPGRGSTFWLSLPRA